MSTVIAIANQKGGVGKTASSLSLAAGLSKLGASVLLVDLDAQASATQCMTGQYGPEGKAIYDVITRSVRPSDIIVRTHGGFDLAPSNLKLAGLDLELNGQPNPDGRIQSALKALDARYEIALIDCPPWLGIATLNAFVAADAIIVPIDCRPEALTAIPQLFNYIEKVADNYERPIPVYALPTFFEQRIRIAQEMLEQINTEFETSVFSPIHKNTKIPEAFLARQTIFDYAPSSAGVVDYHRVAKEIMNAIAPRIIRSGRRSVSE
jgi:chromosome partitioning protein